MTKGAGGSKGRWEVSRALDGQRGAGYLESAGGKEDVRRAPGILKGAEF